MLAVFLDQETTALKLFEHSVIEVAFKMFDLKRDLEVSRFQTIISHPYSVWENRELTSIQINGFNWADIERGLDKLQAAEAIIQILNEAGVLREKATFLCRNPAFEHAFFSQLVDVYTQERYYWPYHWLDLASMFWAFRAFDSAKQQKPVPDSICLSKDAIANFYRLPPETRAHRAMNGVDHLIEYYRALLNYETARI